MGTDIKKVGMFGKLPTEGDFVRYQASGNAWRALDQWIQDGYFLARDRGAFNSGYDEARGYAFLFTPLHSAKSLLGYIHPSRDQIGRKFPLVIAAEVDAEPPATMYTIPVKYADCVHKFQLCAEAAGKGQMDRTSLLLAMQSFEVIPENESLYQDWSFQTKWISVVQDIWGDFGDLRKYLIMKNLVDFLQPLKRGVPENYVLGYRFPASSGKQAIRCTAIWLDFFQRILKEEEFTPNFFWRLNNDRTKSKSSVLLFLRPPSATEMGHMIPLETESDRICDMDEIGFAKRDQAASGLPGNLRNLLDSPEASVNTLLNAVSGI